MEKLGLYIHEFAKEAGLPEQRVRRMVADGAIAADKTTKHALIPRSELERLRGAAPQGPALDEIEALMRRVVREELGKIFRVRE